MWIRWRQLCDHLRLIGAGILASSALAVILLYRQGWIKDEIAYLLLGSFVGIFPGVLHVPNRDSTKPICRRVRCIMSVSMVFLSILAVIRPWLGWTIHPDRPGPDYFKAWLNVWSIVLVSVPAVGCVLKQHPPSNYIRDAVWCVWFLWLAIMLWCIDQGLKEALADSLLVHDFVLSIGLHLEGVVFVWIASLMVRRMVALQGNKFFATRHAWTFIIFMGASFHIRMWLEGILRSIDGAAKEVPYLFFATAFIITWVTYVILVVHCLCSSILTLVKEWRRVSGAPRAEAAWAIKILVSELLACFACGFTTAACWGWMIVVHILRMIDEDPPKSGPMIWTVAILHRADIVINASSVAVLSGLLWQTRRPAETNTPQRPKRLLRRDVTREIARLTDPFWEQKVEQLAHRGFHLEDLLGFWAQLLEGEIMPGFEPLRSTTNDVVRRAIIPQSVVEVHGTMRGRALATIWNDGLPVLPNRMVTHNWASVFMHLVSGIIADCLNEDSYERIAQKLTTFEGTQEIFDEIDDAGNLRETYWVCAMSINQHAGICGGFSPEPLPGTAEHCEWLSKKTDAVTGEQYPLCSCREPKHFNDSPAECEMNKFDTMMRFMNERVPSFLHVVIVDADFDVFYRAWCVAEIVESDLSGIPQQLKILSTDALDQKYDNLSLLDVRDCRASRIEDRDMILSNIKDIQHFNAHLQWAIFGTEGLFSKWFDGQERAALIGRLVRRARLSSNSSNSSSMGSKPCLFSGMFRSGRLPSGFSSSGRAIGCNFDSDDCDENSDSDEYEDVAYGARSR